MSVEASHPVWTRSKATQGSLLVMLAIADHAGPDGVCWPGEAGIAKKARLKVRRVRDVLTELEAAGEIERWHFRDGSRWQQVFQITLGEFEDRRGQRPDRFAAVDLRPGPPPTGRKCLSADRQEMPPDSNQENPAPADGLALNVDRQEVPLDSEVSTGTFCTVRPALSDGFDRHFPSRVIEPSIEPSEEIAAAPASASAEEQLAAALNDEAMAAELKTLLDEVGAGARLVMAAWENPAVALAWLRLAKDEARENPAGFVFSGIRSGELPSPRGSLVSSRAKEKWVENESWRFDPEDAHLIVDEWEHLDDPERALLHDQVDERRARHEAAQDRARTAA